MDSLKYILLIVLEVILFITGGIFTIQFYSFPIWPMPSVKVTMWRDVIIFSIIALIGLALLIFSVFKMIYRNIETINKLVD